MFGEGAIKKHITVRGDGLSYEDWEDMYYWDIDKALENDTLDEDKLESYYYQYMTPTGCQEEGYYSKKRQYKQFNPVRPVNHEKLIWIVHRMGGTIEFASKDEAEEYARLRGGTVTSGYTTLLPGGYRKKKKINRKRRRVRKGNQQTSLLSEKGDQRGLLVPNPIVTVFFRKTVNISTDAAGKFTIYGALRSVIQAYNNTNPFDRAAEYARLYDTYKPTSIRLYMTLQAPMVQATGRIGTSVDYDHTPPSSFTIDDLTNSALYREHRNVGTIDVMIPLKKRKITEGEFTPNGADPSIAIVHQGGYLDFATPVTTGTWFMAGENLPVSSRVGTLVISMMAKCRDSRTILAAVARREKGLLEEPEEYIGIVEDNKKIKRKSIR